MLKKYIMLMLCLAIIPLTQAWDIVCDGVAQSVIVIPEKASQVESYAADELQYIVKKASGIKLLVVTTKQVPSGKKHILIGRAANVKLDGLPLGGYKIQTSADALLLTGRDTNGNPESMYTASGTLYAVYQWAEDQLKVRWIWPSELGEVIPSQKTLNTGNYDLTVSPKLQFARANKITWQWNRRMMRSDLSRYLTFAGASSSGHAFIDWYKRYGKAHPEYFEMDSSGNRINDRYAGMCVSNPKLHQQIVDNWSASKRTHLGVNAKENDAHGRCMCAECKAWDGEDYRWPSVLYSNYRNVGERYARFYKAVWELASKINPDAKVGCYAYMNYVYAPRQTKLNKNIVVGFVDDLPFPRTPEYQQKVNTEIENWAKSGVSFFLRPNYFLSSYAMPEIYYRQYAEEFKLAYRNGMTGLDVDGPNNSWATIGPNLYVMARLAINPEQPVDQIMDEYYQVFGKAAPAIKKYFDYWQDYTISHAAEFNRLHEVESERKWFFYGYHYPTLAHKFFPEKVFTPAELMLEEAKKLAAGDAITEQRVKFLRQGLEHARLCSQTSALFANPKSDNQQRQKAIENVNAFRKNLMPAVADTKYFQNKVNLEGAAWKLRDIDLSNAIPLPEKWFASADPKMNGRDAGYFKPDFESKDWTLRSTWMFLEDQNVINYRYMWYRTSVKIPVERLGWRVIIRLGAIDESGWCWVNGKPVGELLFNAGLDPNSWQTPQEYDITDAVKFGADNQITVLIENQVANGGLWKPSYIRFERAGTGEKVAATFPGNKFYASRITENDINILKMVGRPDRGDANAWQTTICQLPFQNVANENFRIQAEIKVDKINGGEFRIVACEINAAGKTITYDGIIVKADCPWKNYSKDMKIQENAVKLAIFVIGVNLGKDTVAQVKNVYIERLKK
jgi:hypothetical protein